MKDLKVRVNQRSQPENTFQYRHQDHLENCHTITYHKKYYELCKFWMRCLKMYPHFYNCISGFFSFYIRLYLLYFSTSAVSAAFLLSFINL